MPRSSKRQLARFTEADPSWQTVGSPENSDSIQSFNAYMPCELNNNDMSSVLSKQSTVRLLTRQWPVNRSRKWKTCTDCAFLYSLREGQWRKTVWHCRLTKSSGRSVLRGKNGSAQALSFPTIAVLTTELMSAAEHILTPSLRDRSCVCKVHRWGKKSKLWVSF